MIIALVAVVIIIAARALGATTGNVYSNVIAQINAPAGGGAAGGSPAPTSPAGSPAVTASVTTTRTRTATPTRTHTAAAPPPADTDTPAPSETATVPPTSTATASATATQTPSLTPTASDTPSATSSPTATGTATATATTAPPGSLVETETGGANGTTVSTSAALSAVSNDLYLAAITIRGSGISVSSLSGLGLTWTPVAAQCGGANSGRVEVWSAQGTPSADAVVTANLSADPGAVTLVVARYSGVASNAPLGARAAANGNGLNGACAGAASTAAYSVNLTTTAPNSVLFTAVWTKDRTHTPGANQSERADFFQNTGSNRAGIAVHDQVVPAVGGVTVQGTLSGTADWAVIAVEVRAP